MMGKIILCIFILISTVTSYGSESVYNSEGAGIVGTAVDTAPEASVAKEYLSNKAPFEHKHNCGTNDHCGHNCHMGHCGFTMSESFQMQSSIVFNQYSEYSVFIPSLHRTNLFRPPIA